MSLRPKTLRYEDVRLVRDEALALLAAAVGAVEDGQVRVGEVRRALDGHRAGAEVVGGVDVGLREAERRERSLR